MGKQDEKEEAIAPGVQSSKQEGIDISPRKVVVEERQEGAEELQNTAKGKERGKYNQYEDSQIIIEKIRSYRTQRHPDYEIMKFLENMPRRTYYNYVKKLQEQDEEIMEQWRAENAVHVSEEMMIYRETLCQKQRELQAIIENKNTSAKDKMQAIQLYLAISEKLVNFTTSGRSSNMRTAKLNSFDAF
jgi:superfamily II DNA or RNA helicase